MMAVTQTSVRTYIVDSVSVYIIVCVRDCDSFANQVHNKLTTARALYQSIIIIMTGAQSVHVATWLPSICIYTYSLTVGAHLGAASSKLLAVQGLECHDVREPALTTLK